MDSPSENAITVSACWDLLRDGWFGRVALSVDALPAILPVEYRVDRDELAICLGQYRLSQRSLHNSVVAFATDAVDTTSHIGWTVQVQGRARRVEALDASTDCGRHEHGQIIYLAPQSVSGQFLQLCPFGTGLPASGRL